MLKRCFISSTSDFIGKRFHFFAGSLEAARSTPDQLPPAERAREDVHNQARNATETLRHDIEARERQLGRATAVFQELVTLKQRAGSYEAINDRELMPRIALIGEYLKNAASYDIDQNLSPADQRSRMGDILFGTRENPRGLVDEYGMSDIADMLARYVLGSDAVIAALADKMPVPDEFARLPEPERTRKVLEFYNIKPTKEENEALRQMEFESKGIPRGMTFDVFASPIKSMAEYARQPGSVFAKGLGLYFGLRVATGALVNVVAPVVRATWKITTNVPKAFSRDPKTRKEYADLVYENTVKPFTIKDPYAWKRMYGLGTDALLAAAFVAGPVAVLETVQKTAGEAATRVSSDVRQHFGRHRGYETLKQREGMSNEIEGLSPSQKKLLEHVFYEPDPAMNLELDYLNEIGLSDIQALQGRLEGWNFPEQSLKQNRGNSEEIKQQNEKIMEANRNARQLMYLTLVARARLQNIRVYVDSVGVLENRLNMRLGTIRKGRLADILRDAYRNNIQTRENFIAAAERTFDSVFRQAGGLADDVSGVPGNAWNGLESFWNDITHHASLVFDPQYRQEASAPTVRGGDQSPEAPSRDRDMESADITINETKHRELTEALYVMFEQVRAIHNPQTPSSTTQ